MIKVIICILLIILFSIFLALVLLLLSVIKIYIYLIFLLLGSSIVSYRILYKFSRRNICMINRIKYFIWSMVILIEIPQYPYQPTSSCLAKPLFSISIHRLWFWCFRLRPRIIFKFDNLFVILFFKNKKKSPYQL